MQKTIAKNRKIPDRRHQKSLLAKKKIKLKLTEPVKGNLKTYFEIFFYLSSH